MNIKFVDKKRGFTKGICFGSCLWILFSFLEYVCGAETSPLRSGLSMHWAAGRGLQEGQLPWSGDLDGDGILDIIEPVCERPTTPSLPRQDGFPVRVCCQNDFQRPAFPHGSRRLCPRCPTEQPPLPDTELRVYLLWAATPSVWPSWPARSAFHSQQPR